MSQCNTIAETMLAAWRPTNRVLSDSGTGFRPTASDLETNAYLLTHPGIDIQRWLEVQFAFEGLKSSE